MVIVKLLEAPMVVFKALCLLEFEEQNYSLKSLEIYQMKFNCLLKQLDILVFLCINILVSAFQPFWDCDKMKT